MRTRTRGIQLAPDGSRTLDQGYKGRRIYERLGKVSQAEAEAELTERRAAIDQEIKHERRSGAERLWADGAAKYLIECQQRKVRTLDLIAYHVSLVLPYIGSQPMGDVCDDSLEDFKLDRLEDDGVKNATVNRSLEVVRTVMNRDARVWRENGKPWLSASPLIEMLDEAAQKRDPYPLSWAEQVQLLPRLPSLNADMLEFSLNTGGRDENVCGLRWEWEVPVPELQRSVFVIPPEHYKTNRTHVLILNDTARHIVERQRGRHDEFVFVYRRERTVHVDQAPAMEYHRVGTQNNTAFQGAREAARLAKFRIHDARHTFGQRLRAAGVSEEDRALLLGHAIDGMPQHYATAEVARLVDAANSVARARDRLTLLQVANGRATETGAIGKVTQQRKTA